MSWLRTDREVELEQRIKELEAQLRTTAGGGTACSCCSTKPDTDSSRSRNSSTEDSRPQGDEMLTATECPHPGCPYTLRREDDLPYLGCEMHGPMVPVCMECGNYDGRTACGALLCHDCKENE